MEYVFRSLTADQQDFTMIIEFLKLYLNQSNNLISMEDYTSDLTNKINISLKDTSGNRKKRLKTAKTRVTEKTVTTIVYDRNPDVIAEVLERAQGICEHCKNPAPFIRAKDNTPYLEVHHKQRLADDGEDTVENAIAVCPNCHRKLHYGLEV